MLDGLKKLGQFIAIDNKRFALFCLFWAIMYAVLKLTNVWTYCIILIIGAIAFGKYIDKQGYEEYKIQ